MPDDIQIKQFELSELESLLSFLRIAYPDEPRKSDPAYWKWHYLETPYASPNNIPLWVVKSGTQIVGQLATIPVRLKIGDSSTPAIWVLDFIVREDYRGRGLGKGLVLKAAESYPNMITLGINEQSTAVFRSLGWISVGGLHRYQKLLFPGHASREVARVAPLRGLANLLYAPARARISRQLSTPGYVLRELTGFDDSFDDLWQRAAPQWPCAITRSARFLAWQFEQQPGKHFEVGGLYRNETLSGYAVIFFRKPERDGRVSKAAISDLCYQQVDAEQVVDELLKAALRLGLERRVGSLVTDVLDPLVEARLRYFGFWRIKHAPKFMASAGAHACLINDQRNWHLTRADSDVSIFEQPNL